MKPITARRLNAVCAAALFFCLFAIAAQAELGTPSLESQTMGNANPPNAEQQGTATLYTQDNLPGKQAAGGLTGGILSKNLNFTSSNTIKGNINTANSAQVNVGGLDLGGDNKTAQNGGSSQQQNRDPNFWKQTQEQKNLVEKFRDALEREKLDEEFRNALDKSLRDSKLPDLAALEPPLRVYQNDGNNMPGFDCDDFDSALRHYLENTLMETYPSMTVKTVVMFWDDRGLRKKGSEEGHAMTLVEMDGHGYVLDAQSGEMLFTGTNNSQLEQAITSILKDDYGFNPGLFVNSKLTKPVKIVTGEINENFKTEPPPFYTDAYQMQRLQNIIDKSGLEIDLPLYTPNKQGLIIKKIAEI